MKTIGRLFGLAFFLLVFWFAWKNWTPVPVRLSERVVWNDVPLFLVMLGCLVIGALAGAAALAPSLFRANRRRSRHERELLADVATTIQPGEMPADRLADAARNIGAVGQLDADTRFPR
ncbi:MAG TPA: lipopolysaccharide assembly protein LapA domain-containing protein [Xanthobacteraceae bacterium]|nr:lipopolysaccharide assembly protein LapA domain-containing protein [Xanthobacteraceae bacterium]